MSHTATPHDRLEAMRTFFLNHKFFLTLATLLIAVAGYMVWKTITFDATSTLTTTIVTRGDVVRAVSVSGVIESAATAELAFPTTGVVSKVYAVEGATVQAGEVLATLGAEGLVATRASALAELALATADRQELVTGVRSEERAITDTTVAIAQAELDRTKKAQALAVESARRTLLNTAITARSIDASEASAPPIISGTYSCDKKGTYTLSIYSSGAASGYSFKLTGIEEGTYTVSTDQPTVFGTCGLFAKFTAGDRYANSKWIIDIPNISSSAYTQNSTAYEKVQRDADNAIAATTQAVTLAQNKQQLQNAAPRNEALTRVNARVAQAAARVAEVTAQIGDRAIIAPFTGVITYVDILAGETADMKAVITLLGTDAFELTARIPEIDVTKISLNQKANVVFDAKREAPVVASVSYIAPVPTQINGVAYFEIKLSLMEQPEWVRSGLNADIDIIIEEQTGVLIVPNRYLTTKDNQSTVSVVADKTITVTPVELMLRGTDGQAAISGIAEGTIVTTP